MYKWLSTLQTCVPVTVLEEIQCDTECDEVGPVKYRYATHFYQLSEQEQCEAM